MSESVTMDWAEAMRAVLDGLSVRRLAWAESDDPLAFVQRHDGFLMLRRKAAWHKWLVADDDIAATDWVV